MRAKKGLVLTCLLFAVGCGSTEDAADKSEQDVSSVSDSVVSEDGQNLQDSASTASDVEQDTSTADGKDCGDDDTSCDGVDDDCDGQTDEDASSGECDDGNPCTLNGCVDGKCQTAQQDGGCDDGNACTEGDTCSEGICGGKAKDCSDDNACTKDQCNPATGDCGYAIDDGAACDDGNPCTESDVCQGAKCSGGVAKVCPAGAACTIGVCDSSTGSCSTTTSADGEACDDGDPCSLDDTCASGVCQAGTVKPCQSDKPCDVASCDSSTGQCVTTSVADGKVCDDGNPCTQGEACLGGACKGTPVACDDLNPCTTDACDIAVGCTATDNTNPCDDKDPCTVNDTCAAGVCLSGAAKTCDDNNPCTTDVCDQATGGCKQSPAGGGACNDGDYCTLQDKCNEQGGCEAGKAKNCDDGKACTIDSCDPANGKCTSKQVGQGTICDDGSFCTIGDKCDALGVCQPGQKVNCVDNNPCTVDTCVAQTGQCAFQSFPDGAMCDDGDICSTSDSCLGGLCKGKAKNCDDANSCTTDVCDTKNGKCKNTGTSTPCDDSDACSIGENCSSGVCKAPVAGTSRLAFGTGSAGFTDGDISKARVSGPGGLDHAVDGRVFLADRNNHRVRLFTPDAKGGKLSTYAGSGTSGFLDGAATAARFSYPAGVAWHAGSKTLYVVDRNNHRVRKITNAKVTTLAGSSLGNVDGKGASARFNYPEGIDVTGANVVYVADTNNHKIRRITPDGQVMSFAGTGSYGYVDGEPIVARFYYPRGLLALADGSLVVADSSNHRIRKVSSTGVVTTLAGSGSASFLNGPVKSARFNAPYDITSGAGGAILVADVGNRRIRKILAGQVTTYSGSGSSGSTNGAPSATSFVSPQRIAADVIGQVWVADASAHRVRILGVPAASCNDGDPCTKDACDPKSGCKFTGLAKGSSCSDGSACTSGDVCDAAGQCLGTLKVCDDKEPCTVDACDQQTGSCAFTKTQAACDDGDACTLDDNCSTGKCKPTTKGQVTTAFGTGSAGFTDGQPSSARVYYPQGITAAADGRVFLADRSNHRIRVFDTNSASPKVQTYAGSGSSGFLDGALTTARFSFPAAVAWHGPSSTMYVADRNNHRIRKIVSGKVSNFAGSSSTGLVDGTPTTARFYYPEGVAVTTGGVVYVSDTYNHAIRRISTAGIVVTIAGSKTTGYVNGKGNSARFYYPRGLSAMSDGSVLVADSQNHRIRKVTPDGFASLYAGSGLGSFLNGGVNTARFYYPYDVSVGAAGEVLVADRNNHRIRRIAGGQVTVFAGSGSSGFQNGTSTQARFYYPSGIVRDAKGQVWVADYQNHRVRKISAEVAQCDDNNGCTTDSCDMKKGCQFITKGANTLCDDGNACTTADACDPKGVCTGLAKVCDDSIECTLNQCDPQSGNCSFPNNTGPCDDGDKCTEGESCLGGTCELPDSVVTWVGSGSTGFQNGKGQNSKVYYPRGMDYANNGVIYLADRQNNRIRKITPDGTISVHAGSGLSGFSNGGATAARFYYPSDVAVSVDGQTVYVADRYNHRIRKISNNTVTTLAGSGLSGFANGAANSARFYYPEGIAIDPTNATVVVADSYNNRIRRVTASGVVTTIAGSGSASYKEGKGITAAFYRPWGLDVDGAGIIYVADAYNHRVRRIAPDGSTQLLVGSSAGFADGLAASARLNYPSDVSVRGDGKILIADRGNHRIRLLEPNGKSLSTLAGSSAGFLDGPAQTARFSSPYNALALPQALDGTWPFLVSDYSNHRIRKSTKTGPLTCNDGNPCTIDSCDPAKGCINVPVVGECKLGQLVFSKGGTTPFIVPKGVTDISVVAVGAGGGGGGGTTGSLAGSGGGGGALVWGNNIPVTPGETLNIIVGGGGKAGVSSSAGTKGGDTSLRRGAAVLLLAQGGNGGKANNGGATAGGKVNKGVYKHNQGG
ncbi:MAG: hypothetical protein CMH53_08290, partial [Myxococcales bacterium]|nr:hypothetical protein [Myxococcales bacterium]